MNSQGEKNMKNRILILSILPLLLTGCNSESPSSSDTSNGGENTSATSDTVVTKYTVTFANTSMPSVQVEEGKTLAKPTNPTKEGYAFMGWFLDATLSNEAKFPLTVNSDITLYAKFYSYKEAFAKARSNTIGESVPGYEYDYTLDVSATYIVSLTGKTEGNTKYNASSTDVSFYDEHTNSGALFYDGSKYAIKKARNLHEISLDENGIVKKYSIKEVDDSYKYDSSSFAKAVFEYDDEKLKEIKPTTTANEYELKTGFNASSGIALVGNYINHPMIEKILGTLPETSVNTGMHVTFNGDKLNSYRYVMNINVSGLVFNLTYSLTFKNVGVVPSITPKSFNNVSVTESEVNKAKTEINTCLDTYKALEHSGYEYSVKTAVGFEGKNDINATVKGFTKRKVSGTDIYYLNDYEVDSDLKNADLYKTHELKDCHGGRVKLSTGEVHDVKRKTTLSSYKYDDLGTVANPDSSDEYYLFDVLKMINNISFIQKIADTSKGTVTYSVGSDTTSAANILAKFNDLLRINALKACDVDVKAFGSFTSSSVSLKDFAFEIVLTNGAFTSLKLKMNGQYSASYPNSRDFTSTQEASFKLELSLTSNKEGDSYEPAASVDKVK